MSSSPHFRMGRRGVSPRKADAVARQLPLFLKAREAGSADFFLTRLPPGHRLRILPEITADPTFLDIETTGLNRDARISMIGVHSGGAYRAYVRGRDLHEFIGAWEKASVLITFNGIRFDVPFILREFGLTRHPPHIDLLHEARAHGLTGGLKAIEARLGITREGQECGDGLAAVRLWQAYERAGDAESLGSLQAYNRKDVQSLIELTRILWQRSAQDYPVRLKLALASGL